MKRLRLATLAAALVLGACTSSPTDHADLTPAAPSFDGGGMLGTGNRDGDGTSGSGPTITTTSDTTTNRGGGSHGSGN
jgi:hypothetical protein